MKNGRNKIVKDAKFTGRIVYDKNPDKPMYYFEFQYDENKILLSYELLTNCLYKGIEKKMLPDLLFSWLVENANVLL
ncbi:MAG: hypothetical protein IIX47_00400 [Spirochaetaceae bacterium]|nr:hypothetical protein [Spirochaetaceae bacterium]MBQ5876899.1 hypothetical protein [Treponema sp.]